STSGLLVLSEVNYPGWRATVSSGLRENDAQVQDAQIYQVDGLLRGVEIPAGESRVELSYAPRSVLIGALISLLSVLWTGAVSLGLMLEHPHRPLAPRRSEVEFPALLAGSELSIEERRRRRGAIAK